LAMEQNPKALAFASEEILRVLLAKDGLLLEHASDLQKDNERLVMRAVLQNRQAYLHASNHLKSGEGKKSNQVIRIVLGLNGMMLEQMGDEVKGKKEYVRIAIRQSPQALQFASEALRSDPKILLKVLKSNDPSAIKHATDAGKRNPSIITNAFNILKGDAILYVDVKGANSICNLCVLSIDPMFLEHVEDSIKEDRGIVFNTVIKNGLALQFAHKKLHNDWEIVYRAYQQNPQALNYASKDLATDNKDLLQQLKEDGMRLEHKEAAQNHPIFVWQAIDQNPLAIQYAGNRLKEDPRFLYLAYKAYNKSLRIEKDILRYLAEEFKKGGNIQEMFESIGNKTSFLKDLNEEARDNPLLVLKAIYSDKEAFASASDRLKTHKVIVRTERACYPSSHRWQRKSS
ncbi:MAG: DUF4116 domain-containing protein, partial [Chlamydiales bacterium]|nr:DUF4116 domain-containing protein [Chlamydiales bacterium]